LSFQRLFSSNFGDFGVLFDQVDQNEKLQIQVDNLSNQQNDTNQVVEQYQTDLEKSHTCTYFFHNFTNIVTY